MFQLSNKSYLHIHIFVYTCKYLYCATCLESGFFDGEGSGSVDKLRDLESDFLLGEPID
jgi:hypothetical protein